MRETGNGCAPGGRNHLFHYGRVEFFCLQRCDSPFDGLCRKDGCLVSGKAHIHTGIDHAFKKAEDESRSAAAEGCDSIHQVFAHLNDTAERRKHLLRLPQFFVQHQVVGAHTQGPFTDFDAYVWHDSYDFDRPFHHRQDG